MPTLGLSSNDYSLISGLTSNSKYNIVIIWNNLGFKDGEYWQVRNPLFIGLFDADVAIHTN